MATWSRGYIESDSSSGDRREWDEPWTALDANVPAGTPPLDVLLADRPDLAHGQQHPSVPGVYVSDVSAEEIVKGSDSYVVTVRWSRSREEIDRSLPPHQRPAEIDGVYESVEVPTFIKADGTPWLTTAGNLLGDITKTENHWIYSVQKNVLSVPSWLEEYGNAVNSDTVAFKGRTFDPGYLLLKDLRVPLTPSTEEVGGIVHNFYPISFSLVRNPQTWKTRALNRDLYRLEWDGEPGAPGATATPKRCVDGEGEDAEEPMFLDEWGQQLGLTTVGGRTVYRGPIDPEDIYFVEGWNYDRKPFSVLPLT